MQQAQTALTPEEEERREKEFEERMTAHYLSMIRFYNGLAIAAGIGGCVLVVVLAIIFIRLSIQH